ncbi:MAG: TrbC/VirB2 family protein [Bdellovibrio sp.]|nr:TrbC/VirB2 family protein [Bdellovibrio sp.]
MQTLALPLLILTVGLLLPHLGYCDVEGSLHQIQNKLINTILPLAAILGLVVAGFSFVAGSPNARQHLTLAIMGAAIGFGAPSIVNFIQQLVH